MEEDDDLFRLPPGPSNCRKDPVPKRQITNPRTTRQTDQSWRTNKPNFHPDQSWRTNKPDLHPDQSWRTNKPNFHRDQSWWTNKPTQHRILTQNKAPFSQQQTSCFDSKRIFNNRDKKNFSTNIQRYHGSKGNGKKTIDIMGYIELEALAKSDVKDILTNINDKKEALYHLLESPIENLDEFTLIMELLSKVCESSFDQLKLNILLDICNSQFVTSLRNYLTDLPYTEIKSANNEYWKNEVEFWKNFISFCECIILISPQTVLSKCISLIESTSRFCLEELKTRHNFVLPDEYNLKLDELREKLMAHEKGETKKEERKRTNLAEEQEPPDNFRELSVFPSRKDIMEDHPYLRANLIKGKYRDVEHYLDVQFRLLREDSFGPLREGIRQFLEDPTKRKYDNIRVFHNVKFGNSYVSPHKVGFYVEFDDYTKKRFKKINWSHSKRFIFGSLVLFTKDNCNSFLVATIIDRDLKALNNGKIPVSLVDNEINVLLLNDTYTMIESEVYFEPYYHVLKALQDPRFPQHIAMKKYIIDVDFQPTPPKYLNKGTRYKIKSPRDNVPRFNVLDLEQWPSGDDMQLNESQFEAYKMALTHEFAVIQGPPGTGKTYLGIKIAETLLNNLSKSGCLLLLVCYTNHALDQFLEALIKVTRSIVRIGGRSRNEALEEFNLNEIRKNTEFLPSFYWLDSEESDDEIRKKTKLPPSLYWLYAEQRDKLSSSISCLKGAQGDIDSINNDIISFTCMRIYVPDCRVLKHSYDAIIKNNKDPLYYWLFENLTYDFNEPILFKDSQIEEQLENADDKRNTVILDDLEIGQTYGYHSNEIVTVFSLQKVEKTLSYMINEYHSINNIEQKRELYKKIIIHRTQIRLFKQMKKYYLQGTRMGPIIVREDVRSLSLIERWMLYFSWSQLVLDIFKERIIPLQEDVKKKNDAYEETRMLLDLSLLKNYKVVGMTTSGAARLRKLLTSLAPPIVIVEEAAEVLEQHIITSLTNKCKHLILIGDHQQLRPSASSLWLAKHFQLEVSLFERMVLNGAPSRRLSVQHRMRPQLSALITPHIYPDLLDHPSVTHFPDVRGLTRNLFFFTHDYREEAVDDSSSRTNQKEADMTLSLANYIMQQGYEPEDVTILAAYSGQMFYMRKQRHLYPHLSQVKITVVDNFQGEESKIILLSLVRNNDQNKIGFLGIENRICVGLSRAKEGFYIFGNIDILKANSSLWVNIAETLERQDSIGRNIKLKCENHENQITTINSVDDFSKVPEGGCLLKCNYKLPCLHSCPLVCHSYDRGHVEIKCSLKCERIICELQHVCPLKCMDECEPCKIKIKKTLPCGHDMQVFCHLDPQSPEIKCLTVVTVKLPLCGHEVKKSCYMEAEHVRCPVPCGLTVERCGHACVRSCHVADDPDHEEYTCTKPCVKAMKGCTMELEGDRGDHQCRKTCYEECDDCDVEVVKKRSTCKHKERVACSRSADERPCPRRCARALACGHFCQKMCCEPCGDCWVKVKKEIPECGHEVEVECGKAASRKLCTQACARELACGHRCRQLCREECSPAACTELLPTLFDSPCGHRVQLPCNIVSAQSGPPEDAVVVRHCRAACGAQLACGHACGGDCTRCHRGCLHAFCARRCQLPNICGHECNEPCNQLCPPCNKKCEMKCAHGRCPRPCGAPCVSCQEPCARACPHGRCVRRCGEECSRAACAERCSLPLPCGHPCRGLCGERCPDVCKPCRPDDFPVDLLGDQFDDDAMFIVLEDCGHVMEFENMEHLMNSETESVSLRACPSCRKPIINTPRYKDLVIRRFKTDITPINERVYGNKQKNLETKKELLNKMTTFKDVHAEIYGDIRYSDWKKAFDKLFRLVNTNKKYSLIQLNMYFVYLDILEILSGILKEFKAAKLTELQTDLADKNSMICCVLFNNIQKISQQQQMDIGNEMKRMNSIVMLSKLLSQEVYITNKDQPNIMQGLETVKREVVGYGIYKEHSAVDALKNFQDLIKASNIVIKEERELIVKAIGAKAGQWYKCPNGHLYSIDDCGRAMEITKCIECKEAIGGQNHALLPINKHTPEIDNSKYAASLEEADNMANFKLND